MRKRWRWQRGWGGDPDINIINLIDVMFLILTFFIIAGRLTSKEFLFNADLPKERGMARKPANVFKLTEELPIRLGTNQAGNLALHLGTQACESFEALSERLSRMRPSPDCVVEAEGDVKLQAVVSAVEAAKRGGVKKVMMAVPQREASL